MRDVATCVGDLEDSIAAGALIPYERGFANLVHERRSFRMIQALLEQQAA